MRQDYINVLHRLLSNEQAAVRLQVGIALLVVLASVIGIALAVVFQGGFGGDSSLLQKLLPLGGGGAVMMLSAVPLNSVFARRAKIEAIKFQIQEFERLDDADPRMTERAEARFERLIGAVLGTGAA